MKKLVATAPRVAALVEYEDRAILANEVKIRVRFGAPKHGTEVVDFRAASPFIDEDFNGEWQMFTPRPADAPRGIEFGKFQLGNMVVGNRRSAVWLMAAPSPMSRLPSRLPKVLTSDAKRISITPKLSSLARAANRTRIIRAGAASVLKKPVGNC